MKSIWVTSMWVKSHMGESLWVKSMWVKSHVGEKSLVEKSVQERVSG